MADTTVSSFAFRYVTLHPVSEVVPALPRSDLLLLSCKLPRGALSTLDVSPYPAHKGMAIRAYFVTHREPTARLEPVDRGHMGKMGAR